MADPILHLPRRLGLWTSMAIVMGITIGSGIFRVPSSIAQSVDSVGPIPTNSTSRSPRSAPAKPACRRRGATGARTAN